MIELRSERQRGTERGRRLYKKEREAKIKREK